MWENVLLDIDPENSDPLTDQSNGAAEIDHEIFSMVVLSLLLTQEGQLSASGERMCTVLVNRIEG